jgi:hypothetical protein
VLRLGRHLQHHAAGDFGATLKARKVRNIEATKPDVIATGNIGCITQIATGTADPDPAHGRTARLGPWRPKPDGVPDIIRMQPDDMFWPMVQGWLVPWMRKIVSRPPL